MFRPPLVSLNGSHQIVVWEYPHDYGSPILKYQLDAVEDAEENKDWFTVYTGSGR